MRRRLPQLFFFDANEEELVTEVLGAVDAARGDELVAALVWLGRLAGVLLDCPSLTVHDARQASASTDALVAHLGTVSDHDYELHVPTKAALGQAYLVAKINFLKALGAALADVPARPDLVARQRFELGQSIYSRLAEELFVSIVTDRESPPAVKQRAGRFLHRIWESRLLTEIDDFAPLLEAAWEARNQVRPVLGTLLGTHELFRMFQAARDERFLDHFSADEVSPEQTEAFEEFLFGLAHEDLARLRGHLRETGRAALAPDEAARVLGRAAPLEADPSEGPESLYASYKSRKLKASYRAQTGVHGPRHTAEEYVMLAFLARADDGAGGEP